MTVSIDAAASDFMPYWGNPAFDCEGAQIRAQCRHLATVVTISGAIDAMNIDRVSAYSRRFILADMRLVLDLSGVESFAAQVIRFLYRIDEECQAAGVQWALIANQRVIELLRIGDNEATFLTAGSVSEALRHFADVIAARRQLLLPLLTKSA